MFFRQQLHGLYTSGPSLLLIRVFPYKSAFLQGEVRRRGGEEGHHTGLVPIQTTLVVGAALPAAVLPNAAARRQETAAEERFSLHTLCGALGSCCHPEQEGASLRGRSDPQNVPLLSVTAPVPKRKARFGDVFQNLMLMFCDN